MGNPSSPVWVWFYYLPNSPCVWNLRRNWAEYEPLLHFGSDEGEHTASLLLGLKMLNPIIYWRETRRCCCAKVTRNWCDTRGIPPKTDTYSSDLLWVPAGQNIQWGQIPLEILEQRGETAMVDSGNWKKRLPISNCKWILKLNFIFKRDSALDNIKWRFNAKKNLFKRTLEHKQYVQLKLWTWKLHPKSHFLIRMYGSYL